MALTHRSRKITQVASQVIPNKTLHRNHVLLLDCIWPSKNRLTSPRRKYKPIPDGIDNTNLHDIAGRTSQRGYGTTYSADELAVLADVINRAPAAHADEVMKYQSYSINCSQVGVMDGPKRLSVNEAIT